MNALSVLAAALGLLGVAGAAEAPDRAADYAGKFMIKYNPIYCTRAPCPPGSYAIASESGRIASAKLVEFVPAAPETEPGRSAYFEGVAVEGDIWFDAETRTAYVRADRIAPGAWKRADETPGPVTDGGQAPAPVSLVVVNKTRDVVRGLYVSAAGSDNWGPEQLSDNLAINQRVTITLPTADCIYDVRIVLGDRPAEEIRRVDVCRDPVLKADKSGRIIDRAD